MLREALSLAVDLPADVITGDGQYACPQWSRNIPRGEPRIIFHCATRMHVPIEKIPGFDRAIEDIAHDGPLFHIAIEGDGIQITEPGGRATRRFDGDGHLAWVGPARAADN